MKRRSYLRLTHEYVGQTEGCLEGGRKRRERERKGRERERGRHKGDDKVVCLWFFMDYGGDVHVIQRLSEG